MKILVVALESYFSRLHTPSLDLESCFWRTHPRVSRPKIWPQDIFLIWVLQFLTNTVSFIIWITMVINSCLLRFNSFNSYTHRLFCAMLDVRRDGLNSQRNEQRRAYFDATLIIINSSLVVHINYFQGANIRSFKIV